MHLYLNRIEYKRFPCIIWKDEGRLLSILHGVNQEGCKVEPVYLPLLRYQSWPGMITLQTPGLLVILMTRKPYFHWERSKGIKLEDE